MASTGYRVDFDITVVQIKNEAPILRVYDLTAIQMKNAALFLQYHPFISKNSRELAGSIGDFCNINCISSIPWYVGTKTGKYQLT